MLIQTGHEQESVSGATIRICPPAVLRDSGQAVDSSEKQRSLLSSLPLELEETLSNVAGAQSE